MKYPLLWLALLISSPAFCQSLLENIQQVKQAVMLDIMNYPVIQKDHAVEYVKPDSLIATDSLRLREYVKMDFENRNQTLKSFLESNGLIVREAEINYSILEAKVSDMKIRHRDYFSNNGFYQDSILQVQRAIFKLWYQIDTLSRVFEQLNREFQNLPVLSTLNRFANIGHIFRKPDSLMRQSETILKRLNEHTAVIDATLKQLHSLPKAGDPEQASISTAPQIAKLAKAYRPSISLEASRKFGKSFNEIGLFTGGFFDERRGAREAFYYSDLSDFGIYLKGSTNALKLVDSSRKFGINYEITYNQKTHSGDSSLSISEFSFQSFHFRGGIEFVIYKDVLSVYGNGNFNIPVTENETIGRILKSGRSDQFFLDFGIRMLLDPVKSGSSANQTRIFVDLNFTPLNSRMKETLSSRDGVLTSIKMGVQQRLTYF